MLVVDYLEKTEKKFPNKIAFLCEDKKISYRDFLESSKSVGSFLAKKINLQEPIVVFLEKSIETLISFFGILYAGGCYSLVNLEYPKSRIEEIIHCLEAKVIVTDKEHYALLEEFDNLEIFLIEDLLKEKIDEALLKKIKERKIDLDPVYINFTSGSTGKPKGVVVGNRSIIDFIDVFTEEFSIDENDRIANQAPFDFDVSVKDIYSSIKVGATLVLIPKNYFSNPTRLLDYLVEQNITTMIWAVSALCLITTFHGLDYKVPTTVNKIFFSGEVMPMKHLRQWISHLPNCTFVNLYGPTEITCNCTYHRLENNRDYEKIPIGRPFKNERVFLLDESGNEITSTNVTGEICVAGSSLALGYYRNEEQTKHHFIQNPLNKAYNELIYKTGDLGAYGSDGELYFMGRADFQIKFQGHRIELEEIDLEISKLKGVERVVTLFYEKKQRLYCFYMGDIEEVEIAKILKTKLPIFMIPNRFVKVENFMLTKNGKIDRKILQMQMEEGSI